MTPRKAKWAFAGLMALVGVLSDISGQLSSGQLGNLTRPVLIGVIMGGVARVAGAALAARVASSDDGGNG